MDPNLSSEGNNMYVVGRDDSFGNEDILFAASTNNGQTFSAAENLSDNTGESDDPEISSNTS